MKRYLLLLPLLSFQILFANSPACKKSGTSWSVTMEPQKVFIENKGQFDKRGNNAGDKILFATDYAPCQILFTQKGLTYRFEKIEKKLAEDEGELFIPENYMEHEREERERKITTEYVSMEWENANPNTEVVAIEAADAYNSYELNGKALNHVRGFKKLLYKNLYPNIDVEYVFHPQGGIEYNFILNAGADASVIKMKYSGIHKILKDKNGNLLFPTSFGNIIDHTPVTTYALAENAAIDSKFEVNGKTVSFALGNYDKSIPVIIDPWTLTPNLPTTNSAYYIKADTSGNAYIYGGTSPFRLMKYDTAGNLQWTYNTAWGNSDWFGALATDRNGNCFITRGSEASITKIDSSGAFVWNNSPGGAPAFAIEYWALDFNCDQNELYIGGTRDIPLSFTFRGTAFKINMSNGAIISTVDVVFPTFGFGTIGFNEIRSMCASPNGNMYYLTLDTVGAVSPALAVQFGKKSGYGFPYYLPYSNGSTGQGQNNIRATANYIYTTDGAMVHKRDINTGVIIDSAVVTGGTVNNNSGIAIDSCGNVYVGSQSRVIKYDADLTYITGLSTPEPVYDVSIGLHGDVLACGHNYAVALALGACSQVKLICNIPFNVTASAQGTSCGLNNGSATATANGGTAPYSYLWSNGDTTQAISNLAAGTYYVTITDAASNSSTAFAVVNNSGGATVGVTANTTQICASDSAQICAPQGYAAYIWNTGETSQCIYTSLAGNYWVTVTDNGNCTATSNHLAINVYPVPPVSIVVNGDTLSSFGAVSYQWYLNGSPINGATDSVLYATQNGSYTLLITDNNGCPALSLPVVINGIEDVKREFVSVYPNPSPVGSWSISVTNEFIGATAEVFDEQGKLVFKSEIKNQKSEISFDAAYAVYILKITSKKKSVSVKLMKM